MLPYVYQLTKYDPADCEDGLYNGPEDIYSDHGPVEAAYLQAVAAFAEDSQVTRLAVREPAIGGAFNFDIEAPIDGHGLEGLFPSDLTGYHDGAEVSLPAALKLVQAMLRGGGTWCRLEAEDRFFVHVGYDQYVYVGSAKPCEQALAAARALGLFPERLTNRSPYDPELDDGPAQRPADDGFWAEVADLARAQGAVIVEEGYLGNASRWHRLTSADAQRLRARLTPRSRLLVWPDLSPDVDAALNALPEEGAIEIVWMDQHGEIIGRSLDDEDFEELPALLSGAQAVMVVPATEEDHRPLLTAVLPDPDGVLRARWTP